MIILFNVNQSMTFLHAMSSLETQIKSRIVWADADVLPSIKLCINAVLIKRNISFLEKWKQASKNRTQRYLYVSLGILCVSLGISYTKRCGGFPYWY